MSRKRRKNKSAQPQNMQRQSTESNAAQPQSVSADEKSSAQNGIKAEDIKAAAQKTQSGAQPEASNVPQGIKENTKENTKNGENDAQPVKTEQPEQKQPQRPEQEEKPQPQNKSETERSKDSAEKSNINKESTAQPDLSAQSYAVRQAAAFIKNAAQNSNGDEDADSMILEIEEIQPRSFAPKRQKRAQGGKRHAKKGSVLSAIKTIYGSDGEEAPAPKRAKEKKPLFGKGKAEEEQTKPENDKADKKSNTPKQSDGKSGEKASSEKVSNKNTNKKQNGSSNTKNTPQSGKQSETKADVKADGKKADKADVKNKKSDKTNDKLSEKNREKPKEKPEKRSWFGFGKKPKETERPEKKPDVSAKTDKKTEQPAEKPTANQAKVDIKSEQPSVKTDTAAKAESAPEKVTAVDIKSEKPTESAPQTDKKDSVSSKSDKAPVSEKKSEKKPKEKPEKRSWFGKKQKETEQPDKKSDVSAKSDKKTDKKAEQPTKSDKKAEKPTEKSTAVDIKSEKPQNPTESAPQTDKKDSVPEKSDKVQKRKPLPVAVKRERFDDERHVYKLGDEPEYTQEEMALYRERVQKTKELDERLEYAASLAIIAVFCVVLFSTLIWKLEIGRISVDGREAYEIGMNVFGYASTIYEKDQKAVLKSEKVYPGTVKVAVYRLIDEMYTESEGSLVYPDGQPIIFGFWGAGKKYEQYFTDHDYTNGLAELHFLKVTNDDRKNARKYKMSMGRAALIREYTDKYGGTLENNLQRLRKVPLTEITNHEAVVKDVEKTLEELFGKVAPKKANDIPVVITDGSTPMPEAMPSEAAVPTPIPAPKRAAQPRRVVQPRRSTSTSTTQTKPKATSAATSAPSSTSAPSTGTAATAAPNVSLPSSVSRPTANPVQPNVTQPPVPSNVITPGNIADNTEDTPVGY